MLENNEQQDDLFFGMLFVTLRPSNGHVAWCFKEYDPDDRENFPVPVQFKQAGKIVVPHNPGQVFEVENQNSLVIYVDQGYRHPLARGFVKLDYDIGKIPDPQKPDEQVQMIEGTRVNGIPTNVDPVAWSELFYEGRPATLIRRKMFEKTAALA